MTKHCSSQAAMPSRRGRRCSPALVLIALAAMLALGVEASAQLLPPSPIPIPPLPVPQLPPPPLPLPLPPGVVLAPPELPTIPSLPQVLPSNAPPPSSTTQLPVTSARLDAKLLIVSADGTEPVLGAIRQAADYEGIPYTLYIANKTPGGFTPAMLSDGNTHAYYQGIVLTTGTLAYFDGTNWKSAFGTNEWQTLWDYQARYRVRTAIAYAYPTPDLGYGTPTGVDATTTPISASFTSSGQAMFPYVNTANPLVISKAWVYLAHPSGTGNDVVLSDSQGDALALVRNYPDGRQVLSMTFDGNFFLVHSLALGHGLMNWVTGGLFVGERHVYLSPQVDDVFIDDDVYGGGTYRINAADWTATSAWLTNRETQSPTADLRIHMAFNGEGTTSTYTLDTLTPIARGTQFQFPWINHTYSHENLDAASYATAYQEITRNDQIAASMGFTNFDRRALVTPDVSGLANANAMHAAYDAGVRFLVTDTSQPGMDNPSPQLGIPNALEPRILMIPRRPVNLYYNVTTPAQWTSEYNFIYHSYWGRDLSYEEILGKESDVLLSYLLKGEVDPWMFHQSNLRAYDGVHTLLDDLLDRTLAKYAKLYLLPVRSLTLAGLGEWTANRMKLGTAGVQCSFVPSQGKLTLSATSAVVVPVTGLCTASSENYGGQCISHIALGAGQSATFDIGSPGVQSPPPAGISDGGDPGAALRASISPNPLRTEATLVFRTTRAGFARVRVYDTVGQLVRVVSDDAELAPGEHSFRLGGARASEGKLASGVYFYRIEASEGTAVGRFVVLR